MKTIYHQGLFDRRPKRGDLMQSNIGDRRERTWIVLQVHILPDRHCSELGFVTARTRIWAERWWDMEPELRIRLFRSAERNGGQRVYPFHRFRPKRRTNTHLHEWVG